MARWCGGGGNEESSVRTFSRGVERTARTAAAAAGGIVVGGITTATAASAAAVAMVEASSLVDGTAWLFVGGQFMPHEKIYESKRVGALRENLVVVFCLVCFIYIFWQKKLGGGFSRFLVLCEPREPSRSLV